MSNTTTEIPGYALYQKGKGYSDSFKIYVPSKVREERLAIDAEEEAQAFLKTQSEEAGTATRRDKKSEEQERRYPKAKDDEKTRERNAEQQIWFAIAEKDKVLRTRLRYPVFEHEQAMELYGRMGDCQPDDKVRIERMYQRLVEKGTHHREVAGPKSFDSLEALARKQPHMKEVVHFVLAQLKLAQVSRKPVRLQPMLLVGDPGIGKTHFARALATALATTIHIQQLDSDLTASHFLGSDRKWGNTQHGILFDQVVMGEHANPIMVLDEIDKAQRSAGYGSSVGSMYSMLEPLSARRLRDISLMFEFDASLVTWLATANDATMLEPALRSRFREFHIQVPDAQECLVLAEEVMHSAIDSLNIKGFSKDVSIKRHLAHLPARQIWQLTLDAIAKAVAQERKHLIASDLPVWLFESLDAASQTLPNRMH